MKKTRSKRSSSSSSSSSLPSPESAPWLVFIHGKKRSQTFYSFSERRLYVKRIPEMRRCHMWAASNGWLLMLDPQHNHCYIWNPSTSARVELPAAGLRPKHRAGDVGYCVMSSTPTDPSCAVLIVDRSDSHITFCRVGDAAWTRQEYDLGEENGEKNYVDEMVASGGVFYGITDGTNVAVIEVVSGPTPTPSLKIRKVEMERQVEPIGTATVWRWIKVVETSHGQVYHIWRYSNDDMGDVSVAKVMRLNLNERRWDEVPVDEIGDRAFYLGLGVSASWCASDSGTAKGSVYYSERDDDTRLYCWDMDDETVTCTLPCPNLKSPWSQPFLLTVG